MNPAITACCRTPLFGELLIRARRNLAWTIATSTLAFVTSSESLSTMRKPVHRLIVGRLREMLEFLSWKLEPEYRHERGRVRTNDKYLPTRALWHASIPQLFRLHGHSSMLSVIVQKTLDPAVVHLKTETVTSWSEYCWRSPYPALAVFQVLA